MEGTMLGKASENMAVKGNADAVSVWVSSMTIDGRKGLEHTKRLKWAESTKVAFGKSHGMVPVLWGTWPNKRACFRHRIILAPHPYSSHDQRRRDWPGRQFIQPEVWQLAFRIGSSSGAGRRGFLLAQSVNGGVMGSRLWGHQQEGFKSSLCPHPEYQSQDSQNVGALEGPQRMKLEHSRSILN